jgi:hypothetical protein
LSRADFFEDEAVEQILKYSPWWNDAHAEMVASLGKNQEQGDSAALGKKLNISIVCDFKTHHCATPLSFVFCGI